MSFAFKYQCVCTPGYGGFFQSEESYLDHLVTCDKVLPSINKWAEDMLTQSDFKQRCGVMSWHPMDSDQYELDLNDPRRSRILWGEKDGKRHGLDWGIVLNELYKKLKKD